MSIYEKHVFVCENQRPEGDPRGCCASKGASAFTSALKQLVKDAGLSKKVRVNKSGCLDQCAFGAVAVVYPEGTWYRGVTEKDALEVFEQHIRGGKPVERLLLKRPEKS
ncbi:MAG: (2Fe-2S) ferredoxin domain-containing protein [Betaproteobacteria bacterium]|nr:(2Fe-2S) ferredoxin domain-containing protein [Betaproteobacteria bacterium]